MSLEGPCTVLGGLPMWAVCWYKRGDGYCTDDDGGVTSLHWRKRDGSKGAEVSQKIYDRLEKVEPYWESEVLDAVSEHVAYENWLAKQRAAGVDVEAMLRLEGDKA